MGNRNKPPRLTHPLLVAASALTRATDPAKPSRLTVLRLLGDALHALQESHLHISAIKARIDAQLSSSPSSSRFPQQALSRYQLEADNRFRQAHNEGARALFSVTVTALIKLPSRGGPLRRRAIDLLKLAALATGPASAMAAVDRIRSHLSALKRLSWSETDLSDFEIAAILFTVADVSTCSIASRDVARESIHFLLGQRIQQKCRRSDLCHALAVIISSFPRHAPPDDRLVDLVLQFVLAPNSLKQGLSMFGGPLLVSVIAPFVVSRGPAAGDDIALACARTLKIAPTPTERAMWAVALARAVVTARRSSTYQLRKFGTSEIGSKFPRGQIITVNAKEGAMSAAAAAKNFSENDPSVWVSNEIFEEALVKVASMTGLEQGSVDASIAIASVLRMWLLALPNSLRVIVPRSLVRLTAKVSSVKALSILIDGVWLGVLKHLKPSQSPVVFESIIPLVSDSGLTFPAALSVCASLIGKFGRQALRESGLSTEYNTNTSLLIKRVYDSLESVVCVVRLCGVQVLSSVLNALPRTCSQFLTAVLQNLRIADLNIVSNPINLAGPNGLAHYHQELAPLLGNSAALSVIVEKLTRPSFSVPDPLFRQCFIDVLALLRPHQASKDFNSYSPIVLGVRRRVGWGIIASFARGKHRYIFENESLQTLLQLWTEELKSGASAKLSKNLNVSHSFSSSSSDNSDAPVNSALEEVIAKSSARGAALCALSCALQHTSSSQLEQFAAALSGASAARVVSILSNLNLSSTPSSSSATGTFMGFGTDQSIIADSAYNKRQGIMRLLQALAMESTLMTQVAGQVPPTGDSGELCFAVALALAEEAQKALGEVDADHVMNSHLTQGASSSARPGHYDGVLSNSIDSIFLFECSDARYRHSGQSNLKLEKAMTSDDAASNGGYDTDTSWLFAKEGIQSPITELVLIHAGRAIAAVVAEDLSAHGSLIETLPAAKLSPSLCATISLEITKRLSRSHLAEINRALAVLQVLVRRSLGITGGAHRSIISQKRNGRLYTPNTTGDSRNRRVVDIPGILLQEISHSDGALSWSRAFSDESPLALLPFHNYHSRALGTMYATRSLASEAFRELSITGGATLWIGLTQKVIEIVRANIEGATPKEYVNLSNALTTLGALLEVIPELSGGNGKQNPNSSQKAKSQNFSTVNDICAQAISVFIEIIELGRCHVQAASALALSSRSYLVASSSDKLIAALFRAWANDKGDTSALGHFGRYVEESDIWLSCFSRMWSDMGVKGPDDSIRFFRHDSCGSGTAVDPIAIGASNVVEACRLYWWPLKESSISSVREFAIDLVQWVGDTAHHAQTAGLNSIVSIWSRRIDLAQAERSMSLAQEQNGEDHCTDQAVLPAERFSLSDPSRSTNHVGPYLDDVLTRALAPDDYDFPSRELSAAATFAISEMIRGLGAALTCENLPRLPESLFAAVEERIVGANRVLDTLLNGDAKKRPRYWFGLCRAIALGGERLNFGRKGTVWDVSFRTKAYAVRVAVDAIDYSMASCKCREESEGQQQELQYHHHQQQQHQLTTTSSLTTKHTCAFSFLRKTFDFAKQISSAASFDYESCGHGCRLLQRIAARIGSSTKSSNDGTTLSSSDPTLIEFFEMWDPCVAMMLTLLVDRVPHGVVNSAATAISELLVSCSKLRGMNVNTPEQSHHCVEIVSAYLQALVECDLRQRLRYADQAEEIGMRATLALVGKYGRIMSTLKVNQIENGRLKNVPLPGEGAAKNMFFALCGDFIGTLRENGLQLLARDGGALTAGHIHKKDLQTAMLFHIAPIVLGAMSCTSNVTSGKKTDEKVEVAWENENAIGVRMATKKDKYEGTPIACFVWLIRHDHFHSLSKFKQLALCNQVQETLEYIFRGQVDLQTRVLRSEALHCFAEFNKTEVLKFVESMSMRDDIEDETVSLLVTITSSVLLIALQDEFGTFHEDETTSICRGLRALSNIVRRGRLLSRDGIKGHALKILDVIFQLSCHTSVVVASILGSEEVMTSMCETLLSCMEAVQMQVEMLKICEKKTWTIFGNGCKLNCLAMFKICAPLAATICERDGQITSDLLFDMIISEQSKSQFLPVVLNCYGVEDCIVGYINEMSQSRRGDVISLLRAMGDIAVSNYSYSVAVAFRLSVAAVLADGQFCVLVNKTGLTLYCFFLSALIHSLPTKSKTSISTGGDNGVSAVSLESANYFLELVEEEAELQGGFLSSLRAEERERANLFLSNWVGKIETIIKPPL